MGELVWLASYPKSGNTWVRAFLHNYISEPLAPYSINKLTDLSVTECNAVFFNKYDRRPAGRFSTEDVQRLRPLVHQDFTRLHHDLVFVKTHNAALALHGVPLCTPENTAGSIYIVRDPRDIALSYAAFTGLSVGQTIAFMGEQGAASRGTDVQVFEFLSTWSSHVSSWVRSPKTLVLRYEDMLARPETTFGKIIRFLSNEEADLNRLQRAITFSSFEALARQEEADGYEAAGPNAKSRFFRAGKAGQWLTKLASQQLYLIEAEHGTMMRRFGYLKV